MISIRLYKETKKSSSSTQCEIKEKVVNNIEDSNKARDASGYKEWVDEVEKNVNNGGSETKGVGKARFADDILDKEVLEKANEFKSKLPRWAKDKGNFGYCKADIEGLDKSEYFAHSSIQSEIPSVKDSGISIKDDFSVFKTMSVNGDNIVDGTGAWPRDVDTEFKMLS